MESNQDWVSDVNKELKKRNETCSKRGPGHVYKTPVNPYKYKDVNIFKNKVKFRTEDCRFETGRKIGTKDPYGRFYHNLSNKSQCNYNKGVWSDTVNRKTRYSNGQCWVSSDDAHCAKKYEVPMLLRPEGNPAARTMAETIASQKCNRDAKCTWVKMKSSADCFSKTAAAQILTSSRINKPPADMPNDITEGVEEFLYKWYKSKHAPVYTSLVSEGNMCKPTAPRVDKINSTNTKWVIEDENELAEADLITNQPMTPSLPQSVVNIVMKHIASLGDQNTNRGLLAWHSTGSGKTCTAAGVMDAFWDSSKDIVFATSLDALASNPDVNFHECLYNMFPRFQTGRFKGVDKAQTMRLIGEAFQERGIRFLSFAKLSNRVKKTLELTTKGGSTTLKRKAVKVQKLSRKHVLSKKQNQRTKSRKLKTQSLPTTPSNTSNTSSRAYRQRVDGIASEDVIDLNNTILIIDEVHNLFRPLPTQKVQHEYLKKVLADPKKFPGLKIVIMSATPGDNMDDVMMLLNMIRDPTHDVIKAPASDDEKDLSVFRSQIRGLISYFDLSSDYSRFPKVTDNDPEFYPMSDTQFEKYAENYIKTKKDSKTTNYEKLATNNQISKYWSAARKYSNMLYTFQKGMKMSEFSSKLPALLERVATKQLEKHYIYSAFYENRGEGWSSQGILAIANAMEHEIKYTRLTLDNLKSLGWRFVSVGNTWSLQEGSFPPKGKRFIVVTQKEIGDKSGGSDGKLSGSASRNLKLLLKFFNHPNNKYGEYVHAMLASQSFNEGIDLKAVRHIHIFEPLVTMASDKQTLGRAARFCSHGDLDRDKNEWTVDIHRYMSATPLKVRVNQTNTAPVTQASLEPTAQESKWLTDLQDTIYNMQSEIVRLEEQYKNINPRERSDQSKQARASIKEKIASAKGSLKEVTKKVKILQGDISKRGTPLKAAVKSKKRTTIDAKDVEMIDHIIFMESRERVKDLFAIFQTMKEAAIDCRMLSDFHAKSGNNVSCGFITKNNI